MPTQRSSPHPTDRAKLLRDRQVLEQSILRTDRRLALDYELDQLYLEYP